MLRILPQASSFGALYVGLDGTPTGTDASNVVVADFTGAVTTLQTAPSAPSPVTAFHSQTLGSRFHVDVDGMWLVRARVHAQTAASVRAAIGLDNVAADLLANPLAPNFSTIRDTALRIAAGADTDAMMLAAIVPITRDMANQQISGTSGNVRLLLSNNTAAGAAAAALNLPLCWISVERIFDIPANLL